MSRSRVQRLRDAGFDLSKYVGKAWIVRCSGCDALVINGIPCHERACPNEVREQDD